MLDAALKPIEKVGIARLFFNKGMWQFHDCLERNKYYLYRNNVLPYEPCYETTDALSVDMARNRIVAEAISKGLDALIWVDTDLIFPDDAFARLVGMANAGHLIAGGLYRRGGTPHYLYAELESTLGTGKSNWATLAELRAAVDPETRVVPLDRLAGGFTIVRIELFQAIAVECGMPWYCNWDWDREGRPGYGAIGEDSFFLLRAAEVGVRPVVDPELHAVHWPLRTGAVPVVNNQPELRHCYNAVRVPDDD